jgi:hypothetical protein
MIFRILILAFFVCSCGSNNNKNTKKTGGPTEDGSSQFQLSSLNGTWNEENACRALGLDDELADLSGDLSSTGLSAAEILIIQSLLKEFYEKTILQINNETLTVTSELHSSESCVNALIEVKTKAKITLGKSVSSLTNTREVDIALTTIEVTPKDAFIMTALNLMLPESGSWTLNQSKSIDDFSSLIPGLKKGIALQNIAQLSDSNKKLCLGEGLFEQLSTRPSSIDTQLCFKK